MIVGITLTDPWKTDKIAKKLKQLPSKPWVRVVFDEGVDAQEYISVLKALRPVVSGVLGEILDSQFVADISLREYEKRAASYFAHLRGLVDVWEVGNEVNGEWTGNNFHEKVYSAYRSIKAMGGKVAITLYYDEKHGWMNWLSNVPAEMLVGADWALMSSYPHDVGGVEGDWQSTIATMGAAFPKALLGIGECGKRPVEEDGMPPFPMKERVTCFRHYYKDVFNFVKHPRFIGGGFCWYQTDTLGPLYQDLTAALEGK
jgi:hypothetical protein